MTAVRRLAARLRRWWYSVHPGCSLCGSHMLAETLPMHLRHEHTPSELRAYVEDLNR